jgi:hypothetical protein
MAAKDDLINALAALETAAHGLATARANFVTAASGIINAAETENRKITLNSSLGPRRVDDFLVMRLRALGLGPVLDKARTPGTLPESWTTDLRARVNALV